MLEIIDNVFDEKTIDNLYGYFRDGSSWRYTGTGTEGTNWRKFSRDLDENLKEEKILYKKAEKIFNNKLFHLKKTHFLDNAYSSGYVYLNKVWDVSYSGETVYTDPLKTEIVASVLPKPGRVVVFDGQIPHVAREVSRTCVELRMVATFKYRKKDDKSI
jgi:hypothetical protein